MMFEDQFETIRIGKPLLFDTEDQRKVVLAVMEQFPGLKKEDALVLMGHGTEHPINAVYAAMDYLFKDMGYPNVFVGTVEAYPDLDTVVKHVNTYKPEKVVMMPLMVVAGDHAVNDMASGEEDSWKSVFRSEGFEVECLLKGLGELQSVRDIYLEHVAAMLEGE
jgi:sirohydrochlorin cobaltochelatase